MYRVSKDLVLEQEEALVREIEATSKVPFVHSDLVKEVMTRDFEEIFGKDIDPEDSYEIKIAPSAFEMAKGNFEPVKVFRVPKWIEHPAYPGIPLWFDNTMDGIKFRGLGYKNGDRRLLSPVKLGRAGAHPMMSGSTGQGKSVAVNSILTLLLLQYPPWELKHAMSDSKMSEFPKYTREGPVPQIESLVASSDAEYIISMLEYYETYMNVLNAVFPKMGVENIQQLRQKTGLHIPRILVSLEEFQMTILKANRRKNDIILLAESYSRVGRSAGVHLFPIAQDLDSIPPPVTANMTWRLALGSSVPISNKLLGNPMASLNFNQPGKMIANNQPFLENNESHNQNLRVPYIDSEKDLSIITQVCRDLGERFPSGTVTSQYMENDILTEEQYYEVLGEVSPVPNKIYLGEPSFVYLDSDKTKMFDIEFTGREEENIVTICNGVGDSSKILKLLLHNFKRIAPVSNYKNIVICSDLAIGESLELAEVADLVYNCRNSDDSDYQQIKGVLLDRALLIEADNLIFDKGFQNKDLDFEGFLDSIKDKDSYDKNFQSLRNDLTLMRVAAMRQLSNTKPFDSLIMQCNPSNPYPFYEYLLYSLSATIELDTRDKGRTTKEMFSMFNVTFIGFNRLAGVGYKASADEKAFLNFLFSDGFLYNYRSIIHTTDPDDMTDYRRAFRYGIYDSLIGEMEPKKVGHKEFSKEEISSRLLMWSDRRDPSIAPKKFKKFSIGDEIFK